MKFATGLLAIVFGLGCVVAGLATLMNGHETSPGSEDAARGSVVRRSIGLEYEIVTAKGHDYLFLWNYVHGCCVIHAESCPCKGIAHTN